MLIRPLSAESDPGAVLTAFAQFWNHAFHARRHFVPWSAAALKQRLCDCPAFDPAGLFFAWQQGDVRRMVGVAHAFKPAPDVDVYRIWEPRHHLALLYVTPEFRGQGIGSRLLRVAENWLYYCPVYVADQLAPCYGALEGLRPPPFGSTERMGIPMDDGETIRFFARHGYVSTDVGDVSMVLATGGRQVPAPPGYDLRQLGLSLHRIDPAHPFTGKEPAGREIYTVWRENDGKPFGGILLTDAASMLRAHISWYPVGTGATMALGNFWVAPDLRGRGLGGYLLDAALHAMTAAQPETIELHTHLLRHSDAVSLYQARGFQVETAWVNLVKQ